MAARQREKQLKAAGENLDQQRKKPTHIVYLLHKYTGISAPFVYPFKIEPQHRGQALTEVKPLLI